MVLRIEGKLKLFVSTSLPAFGSLAAFGARSPTGSAEWQKGSKQQNSKKLSEKGKRKGADLAK